MTDVIGEAFVVIRPELSQLFKETSEGVTKSVEGAAESSKGSFDKIANVGKAAFVGLTTAAVGFGIAAVKEALEGEKAHALLNAAVNAAGGSMEAFEPKVDALSNKMAKLGFTNDEVEQGLARLTQITGDPTKALELMGTTADFARARHLDLEQAATLVGRAAEGNVTPLTRMGIQIKATGDKAADGATAIAALNARFGGAAQAEADTYAGKLAAFRAEISNLTEKVGNELLPVLAKGAGAFADTVSFFEQNRAAAVALGIAVGGPLVVALGAYAIQEGLVVRAKLADFFETAGLRALYMADAVKATAASVAAADVTIEASAGLVGLLAAALSAFILVANKSEDAAAKAGDAYATSFIDEVRGAANEQDFLKSKLQEVTTEQYLQVGSGHELGAESKTLADRLAELKQATKGQADAQQQLGEKSVDALDGIAASTNVTVPVLQQLADKLKIDVAKGGDEATAALEKAAGRLQETRPVTLELSDALAKLSDQTADATEKSKAFKTALDLLIGGNIDAEKAVVTLEGAIDGLGEKVRVNASSLDAHTKAGRENLSAIEDVVVATRNHIEALEQQGATADQIRGALASDTEELRKQLTQTGLTKAQIDQLIASYGLVPSSINTVVTADLSQAVVALQNLSGAALAAERLTSTVTRSVGGSPVRHLAGGALLTSPEFVLAGEAGPELVLPLNDRRRMAELFSEAGRAGLLSGSGGGVAFSGPLVHIGSISGDPATVMRAVETGVTHALEEILNMSAALTAGGR